jgi:hypothetical protein
MTALGLGQVTVKAHSGGIFDHVAHCDANRGWAGGLLSTGHGAGAKTSQLRSHGREDGNGRFESNVA